MFVAALNRLADVVRDTASQDETWERIATDPALAPLLRAIEQSIALDSARTNGDIAERTAGRDIIEAGGDVNQAGRDIVQGDGVAGDKFAGDKIGGHQIKIIVQNLVLPPAAAAALDDAIVGRVVDLLATRLAPPRAVAGDALALLRHLVEASDIDEQAVRRAYWDCLPPGWIAQYGQAENLVAILNQLALAPQQSSGALPIVAFVHRIASQTAIPERRDELRAWATAHAARYGLPLEAAAAMGARPIRAGPPYLLVRITPDKFASHNVRVQIYIMNAPHREDAYIYKDAELRSFESIPELLHEQLRSVLGDDPPAEMADLVIEVFMPRELFCFAVDLWPIKQGRRTMPLGFTYRVVVRALERLYDKELQEMVPFWKRNWKRLGQPSQGAGDLFMLWPDERAQGSLYDRLLSCETSCLALAMVPPSLPDDDDALVALLDAGTPVALWLRRADAHEDVGRALRELLDGYPLVDLPTLVWRKRQEAVKAGDDTHIGSRLTLLWDDPERLPPSGRLTAKSEQGSDR